MNTSESIYKSGDKLPSTPSMEIPEEEMGDCENKIYNMIHGFVYDECGLYPILQELARRIDKLEKK